MARFNASQMDNYSQNEGSKTGFFSLKDDKDTATVRFMYESAEDIEGFSVHRVKVGDRERYVNCLREYNEPMENCPFCAAKIQVQPKLFIPLYNETSGQIQFWERGRKFYAQISGLVSRYKNIVQRTFDIERNGAKGDTGTTYSFYPVGDPDGTIVQDILDDLGIESLPSPIGTIILDKTADEMDYYLNNGDFPEKVVTPTRRRSSRPTSEQEDNVPFDEDEPVQRTRGRRTPANGSDRF